MCCWLAMHMRADDCLDDTQTGQQSCFKDGFTAMPNNAVLDSRLLESSRKGATRRRPIWQSAASSSSQRASDVRYRQQDLVPWVSGFSKPSYLHAKIHSLIEALRFGVAVAIQDLEGICPALQTRTLPECDTMQECSPGPRLLTT